VLKLQQVSVRDHQDINSGHHRVIN